MLSNRTGNSNITKRVSIVGCPFFGMVSIALLLCLSGCLGKRSAEGYRSAPQVDFIVPLHYAEGFEVAKCGNVTRVTVFQPFSTRRETLQRYYLYPASSEGNLPLHADGISLRVPLRSLALGSCTQVEFVQLLAPSDCVRGICNAQRIYSPSLRARIASGQVADLGDAFQIDLEQTLALGADALMMTGYGQVDSRTAFLEQSGVPVIYNCEWTETDLLGRAEWIRFVACFFDREQLADSLFETTIDNYRHLKALAESHGHSGKSLLSGENFRGTWYLPGGRSYMAQLFRDSGGTYRYGQDTTSGSLSRSVEQVLRDFSDADIWVGVEGETLEELSRKDAHHRWFKAWKIGEVYAYDLHCTPEGGNDYWESAVAHPDRLLSDFVKLLHPQIMSEEEWHYLRQLPHE